MVDGDVGVAAAVKHPAAVGAPRADKRGKNGNLFVCFSLVPGVHIDGERPDLGQVLHHLLLAGVWSVRSWTNQRGGLGSRDQLSTNHSSPVGGEGPVAGEPHAGRHAVIVVAAVPSHSIASSVPVYCVNITCVLLFQISLFQILLFQIILHSRPLVLGDMSEELDV